MDPGFDNTGMDVLGTAAPIEFKVTSHPNPLHGATTIRLALPAEGNVLVEVFDIQGRKITTLFNGSKTAGYHDVAWDGALAGRAPSA